MLIICGLCACSPIINPPTLPFELVEIWRKKKPLFKKKIGSFSIRYWIHLLNYLCDKPCNRGNMCVSGPLIMRMNTHTHIHTYIYTVCLYDHIMYTYVYIFIPDSCVHKTTNTTIIYKIQYEDTGPAIASIKKHSGLQTSVPLLPETRRIPGITQWVSQGFYNYILFDT